MPAVNAGRNPACWGAGAIAFPLSPIPERRARTEASMKALMFRRLVGIWLEDVPE